MNIRKFGDAPIRKFLLGGANIKSYKYPASGIEKPESLAKEKTTNSKPKMEPAVTEVTKRVSDQTNLLDPYALIIRIVYPDPRGKEFNDTVHITTYGNLFEGDEKTERDYVTHRNGKREATRGYYEASNAYNTGQLKKLGKIIKLKQPSAVKFNTRYLSPTKYIKVKK